MGAHQPEPIERGSFQSARHARFTDDRSRCRTRRAGLVHAGSLCTPGTPGTLRALLRPPFVGPAGRGRSRRRLGLGALVRAERQQQQGLGAQRPRAEPEEQQGPRSSDRQLDARSHPRLAGALAHDQGLTSALLDGR